MSPPASSAPAPRRPGFPAWAGWSAVFAACSLALVTVDLRLRQRHLLTRVELAEQESRLLHAELRAAHNQLEAERLLTAAQNRFWLTHPPAAPAPGSAPGLPSRAP